MNVPFPDTNMGALDCQFYPERKAEARVLFDLRIPGAAERSDIEALDMDHIIPIIRLSEAVPRAA